MPNSIIVGMLAAVLPLIASEARADDRRVPAGMLLCRSAAALARPDHPGCWIAAGGQVVERINPVVTWSQLIIRSTNGEETMVVYARKGDADQILRQAPPAPSAVAEQAD